MCIESRLPSSPSPPEVPLSLEASLPTLRRGKRAACSARPHLSVQSSFVFTHWLCTYNTSMFLLGGRSPGILHP